MNAKQKSRWWLDFVLFSGLIIACLVDFTGIALHQWIGIFAGGIALYHLVSHRRWIEEVSRRFFGPLRTQLRVSYLIDFALLAGFILMILTGLVISTWFDFSLTNFAAWRSVHIAATIVTLVVTLVKIVLHRNWILTVARKWVFTSQARPPVIGSYARRDFLSLMGVVGAASFLALNQSIRGIREDDSDVDTEQTAAGRLVSEVSGTSLSAAAACTVRCGKGCSFPGRCRRYTDDDGNNRCDLGECL